MFAGKEILIDDDCNQYVELLPLEVFTYQLTPSEKYILRFKNRPIRSFFYFLLILGKIDFEEFSKVTVPVMKDYFDKVRRTKPRLRSRNSRQVWMFHNDPKYPILSDFHGR